MNWETILFLGDSLTFGARSYLGYPERCGALLSDKLAKDWNVVNHATNGFTAIDLARSMDGNYVSLASQTPVISFILIGTNDAKTGTSNENYTIALEQIIVKSKLLTLNANVRVLKIPQLAKGVAYPFDTEMNIRIHEYNQIIDVLAAKHGIKSVAIELDDAHFYDGIHFNEAGILVFAEGVAHSILKERGI